MKSNPEMQVLKIRKKITKKKYKLPDFMPIFVESNYQTNPTESELR